MGTSKAQSVIYHATVMLFIYVKRGIPYSWYL